MTRKTVSATDFQNRAGVYMEESAKAPVYITKHNRPVRVLVDVAEYERLKAFDTRRVYRPKTCRPTSSKSLRRAIRAIQPPTSIPFWSNH